MTPEMIAEILETIMILAFGLSWPLSIYKSVKSRTAKGKSLQFEFFIWLGYIAGIAMKFIQCFALGKDGPIFYLGWVFYVLNFVEITISTSAMSSSIRRETPRRTSKRRTGNAPAKRQINKGREAASFPPFFACGGCGGLRLPHGVYPAGNRGAARPSGHGNAGLRPGAGRLEARARPLFRRNRPALTQGPGG